MSELLKTILLTPSGGAAKLEVRKDANIFSAYNLCSSVPFKELVATLTSLGTLSIAEVRLVATGLTSIYTLSISDLEMPPCQLASTYSLETNPTPDGGGELQGFQTRLVNNVVLGEWEEPANAFLEDDQCTFTTTAGAENHYNFINDPFTIPAGVTITGLYLLFRWGADGEDFMYARLVDATLSVRSKWGVPGVHGCVDAELAAGGGDGDLWGGTWTPEHINSAAFECRICYYKTGKPNPLYIDFLEVTVYFTT